MSHLEFAKELAPYLGILVSTLAAFWGYRRAELRQREQKQADDNRRMIVLETEMKLQQMRQESLAKEISLIGIKQTDLYDLLHVKINLLTRLEEGIDWIKKELQRRGR